MWCDVCVSAVWCIYLVCAWTGARRDRDRAKEGATTGAGRDQDKGEEGPRQG